MLEEIFESMLAAIIYGREHWLAVVVIGLLAIVIGKRLGTKIGVGILVLVAVVSWSGSVWLESQCAECDVVSHIVYSEVRLGLLFWEILFLAILLILKANTARKAKRIKKEV
jgi:hypothetical protein